MGSRQKADYADLEKRYVTEGLTYSQLARAAGVSPQSVSEYARRKDWPGKRAAYEAALSRRSYEVVASSVAHESAEIRKESILVARATLRAYAKGLAEGQITPSAKDAALMIDLLIKELTPSDDREHGETIVSTISPDSDFLRSVVEAARGQLGSSGNLAGAAMGGTQRTRSN